MRRSRRISTLPKLAQITGPSSHHLAAPDLFRLWSVRWRRPQLRPGSGRVENVRYGLLGLALTTTMTIFEFADPKNLNIHTKIVSLSCTEMKLCLFECLAYLCHCGYFFAKNSRNCEIFLIIKREMGTRIHGNTSNEPLTTFLR